MTNEIRHYIHVYTITYHVHTGIIGKMYYNILFFDVNEMDVKNRMENNQIIKNQNHCAGGWETRRIIE